MRGGKEGGDEWGMMMDSNSSQKKPWQFWVRLFFFILLLGYMGLGPIPRQIFGSRNPYFPKWRMFKGKGVGLMDVKFYQRLPDGKDVLLDRFEILKIPGNRKGNKAVWRMKGIRSVYEIAYKMCRRMGREADLRVVARRATRQGWELKLNKEENVCRMNRRSRIPKKGTR